MRVAVIQMASGPNKAKNLKKAKTLILKAVKKKAKFIVLPELFLIRGNNRLLRQNAESVKGSSIKAISEIALKNKVNILAGSIPEKSKHKSKVYNTSVFIDSLGKIKSVYQKRHLFNLSVKNNKVNEKEIFLQGSKNVVAKLKSTKIGLSICFDLRFSSMYLDYASKGTSIICVPSAFTKKTGKDHWEVLVRSRAIETQNFILAPNQHGKGTNGIVSFGNSMIVDPWGSVLKKASSGKDEVLIADLDFSYLKKVRKSLPISYQTKKSL